MIRCNFCSYRVEYLQSSMPKISPTMFCARCGNDLGEKPTCDQCSWSISEIKMPVEPSELPRSECGVAFASLICGIVSWCTCGGMFIIPLVGLILGRIGLKSQQPGLAMAGIILNAAMLVLCVMIAIFVCSIVLVEIMNGAPPSSVPSGRCC